jgi:hypothetical protein
VGRQANEAERALDALRKSVERWRRTRASSRSAMPEELWRAAVALCQHYTVHSVSQQLGLGYDRLRRRWVEAQVPERVEPAEPLDGLDAPIEFVEVGRAVGHPAAAPAGRAEGHEVEFVRPDGARMILRSRQPPDLRQLACVFLAGGA